MTADKRVAGSCTHRQSTRNTALFVAALLLLPALSTGQTGKGTEPGKLPEAKKARESSFPKFRQAGDLPTKNPVSTEQKKAAADSKAAAKKNSSELLLMQTREALPLRKSRSLGVTPFVEKAFPKGTLVWLLEVDAEARSSKVAVLGGMEGYVFAKFVEVEKDGWGRITTKDVNFRHQARAATFPVDVTKTGMRFKLLEKVPGKKGNWWKVLSNDQIGVWVPSSGLELQARVKAGDANPLECIPSEALKERALAQIKEREDVWVAGIETRKKQAKRLQDISDLTRALGDFRAEFEKLMSETSGDPDLEALEKIGPLLTKIQERAAELKLEKESIGGKIALMLNEFKHSRLVAKSKLVVQKTPKEAKVANAGLDEVPKKNMRPSFTGWIVYRPGRRHYSDYQLVKGNKTIFYLTCSSNRYELGDFVDRRISIRADTRHIPSANFRVADIKKLLILSTGH